jgi:YD repeat-containing protein
VLGDIDGIAWPSFVARDELVDTLFSAALNTASTGSACDWLSSLLSSQLGSGLVLSTQVNHAPEITSVPITYAAAGSAYSYAVTAVDANGDTLRYALAGADAPVPTGLAINPAGLISWSNATPGSYALIVRVDDGVASTEQRYTLTVGTEPAPLELQVALLPSIANAGDVVTLTVLASGGNGGTITKTASLNGSPLVLNPQGVASFAAPAAGVHRVQARATAAAVNGSTPPPQTRELLLTVRDAGDTTPPVAAITSPAADAEVTSRITVIGTATDTRFASYQLLLRPADTIDANPPWTEITRGLAPVTAGPLGQLDPGTLANGEYQLGLRVVDVNGQQASVLVPIEITRERKLGPFRISFTDVRTDAVGLPLMLTRSYDSAKKDIPGDFGWGWAASANDVSVRKNMVLGTAWEFQQRQLQQCLVVAGGKRRVTVSLPDGGVYRFQARNEPECAFGSLPQLNIVMDPLPLPVGGTSGGSAGSAAGTGQLEVIRTELVQARGGHLLTDLGEIWNPRDFKFTSPEGFVYILKEGVGVIQVTDPYGNTVSYGANGYQHSANIGIQLTRDAQGRITKATDPQGKSLSYAYNSAGELASVTDRLGQTTRFDYGSTTRNEAGNSVNNRHLLTRITDPRGQVVLQSQFDEYGRLTAAADAQGQSAQQSFDEANNQMRVVDRRGNPSTYTFDAQGNVTRIVDAAGGITDITYDANGNELTRKDPLGHISRKTYDASTGKILTETDPQGRTTTTAYPTVGRDYQRQNPLSVTDPKGNVTRYGYPAGQEQQPGAVPSLITELLGRTTAIGLDNKGNLRSLNVAGISTSYDYDAKGRRTTETDGLGKVTTYSYDDNGNELSHRTGHPLAAAASPGPAARRSRHRPPALTTLATQSLELSARSMEDPM